MYSSNPSCGRGGFQIEAQVDIVIVIVAVRRRGVAAKVHRHNCVYSESRMPVCAGYLSTWLLFTRPLDLHDDSISGHSE